MAIRLGLAALTDRIYAGRVSKSGTVWLKKEDVSNDFWGTLISYSKKVSKDFTISVDNGEVYRVRITKRRK